MAALVLMILASVLAVGILGFGIFKMVKVIKSNTPLATNYPLEVKKLLFIATATSVATLLAFVFLVMYQGYKLSGGEWVELVFGSLMFGFGLPGFVYAFFTQVK